MGEKWNDVDEERMGGKDEEIEEWEGKEREEV